MKFIKPLKSKYLRFHSRSLFLIDMIYNMFFLLILIPFAGHTLELVMDLSRISYITPENAFLVLTSPPALLLFIVLVLVFLVFLLMKLSSLMHYCAIERGLKQPYLIITTGFGAHNTIHSFRKSRLMLLLFLLPFYILANLPILVGIILHTDLEFTRDFTDEIFVKCGLLLLLFAVSFLAYHGLFAIHYSMNEKLSFRMAWSYSKQLITGKRKRTLLVLTAYQVLSFLSFSLFYYVLLFLTAIGVYLFGERSQAVTVFLIAYTKINIYATLLFGMINFAFFINLTSSLFHTYREDAMKTILPDYPEYKYSFTYRSKAQKWMTNSILVLIVLLSANNMYFSIRSGSSYLDEALTGVTISSHRGNSRIAPENTLPAIESAIAANSDYVEIDVQQSRDGTLVLMHDRSLARTAGRNDFIWDLTDEELNALDVGLWFSLDYINTKIPTLEEVLSYCKDRCKLNIELKINNNNIDSSVSQLVSLIEEYQFEDQCVISSSSYFALKKVKELNENLRTGYILSAVFGNFYDKEDIDFFSIRYNFVNQTVVKQAHLFGKEIHAWTVNTSSEIERMKSAGVDTIITDYPSLAREVLYRDTTNDSFIELIRRMFNNRSFYRFSQLLD